MPSSLLRLVVVITLAGVVLAASTIVVAPQIGAFLTAGEIEAPSINLDPLAQRSLAFAQDGTVLATFHAEENRQELPLDEIPETVKATIISLEDEDFYSHNGVNLRATLRALAENVSAGGVEQGGSTITQQLVKNSLLTPEQDLNRKVQEAILAIELEKELTKDEILERYLNQVYFGGGAYGVQAGAELYWGIDAAELDWGQAALLASLIQNPVGYDPVDDPDTAREQRGIALDLLVDAGHLTREEADGYHLAPLPEARLEVLPAPDDYFIEVVKQQLLSMDELGETQAERYNAVFKGGLRVSTTFVPTAQFFALAARDNNLPDTGGRFTSAMASIDASTGAVRALVGGPGFENYKYDLATQGERQPGSSFKIFSLVEALEQGFVPNDTINGSSPCRFPNPGGTPDPYVAENFGGSAGGNGTIRQITTASSNCGYLRLATLIGRDKVVERAKAMGVTSPIDNVPAMPIGTEEVSPLDMATAAAVLANGGVRNDPYFIERIEDSDGEVLYQHRSDPRRVVSARSACLATQILEANVAGGTGTAARLSGMSAAGKTGTSENFEDAWFVGYTPYLASAVWMGNPAAKVPMTSVGGISVTGGSFPARIWHDFNQAAHSISTFKAFPSCTAARAGQDFTKFFTDEPEDAVCPDDYEPADLDEDGTIEICILVDDEPAPTTVAPAPAPARLPLPLPRHRRRQCLRQRLLCLDLTPDPDQNAAGAPPLMPQIDQLLEVQEHDTTAGQLRHRRSTLQERTNLEACREMLITTEAELASATEERAGITEDIKRVEQEVASLERRVTEVDHLLHSGAVAAPRELKALQDEIGSLQRRQRMLEDGELDLMERAEPLDKAIDELSGRHAQLEARAVEIESELAAAEAAVDDELVDVAERRAALAAELPDDMLASYEGLRRQLAGVAVAKLSGGTCGGCFLSLSAVEVDRIKKQPANAVINCEECGRILVR